MDHTIRWAVQRPAQASSTAVRHAYDLTSGAHGEYVEALCGVLFGDLPTGQFAKEDEYAPSCPQCRQRAWQHVNPGVPYPGLASLHGVKRRQEDD